jgi:hypothetical protein
LGKTLIIIINSQRRVHRHYENKAMRLFLKRKLLELYPHYPIYILESGNCPPPQNEVLRFPKRVWCPYCRGIRHFYHDKEFDVHRCPIDTITENDFWVKKWNNLYYRDSSSQNKKKGGKR